MIPVKVEPRKPGGFQDFPPDVMVPRQKVLDTVRRVYERFGFVPLDTSAVEYYQVLTGGESTQKRIYQLNSGSGDDIKALRFDLTVPLARFVAANWPNLPHPFKRYQLGNVWRGERRQRGRFNEFAQFDFDTVGSADIMSDFEVAQVIWTVMRELGVKRFTLRTNNRKVLNALPSYAGFNQALIGPVLQILDKVDKVGREGVLSELAKLELGTSVIERLEAFMTISATDNRGMLAALASLVGSTKIGEEGVAELAQIVDYAEAAGMSQLVVDPSIARGLDYYTGPIFETTLDDEPALGSVFSGGRYDGLVSKFSDLDLPATGASIGVDRFAAVMVDLGLFEKRSTLADVLITRFDRSLDGTYLQLAGALRAAGINTELYTGSGKFRDQRIYADKLGIPILVIVGPDEQQNGTASVKDMRSKTQVTVPQTQLPEEIAKMLRGD